MRRRKTAATTVGDAHRRAGPFDIPGPVGERCGGVFDQIDDVMPSDQRKA